MKQLLPTFSIILAAGLILVSGLIHGRMSRPSPDVLPVAGKLKHIPKQVGSWEYLPSEENSLADKSSEKMEDSTVDMLQCAGYIVRTYKNENTGESVNMFLIVGPSGPTSVHTPEVCYDSRGYPIRETRQRVTIQDAEGPEDEQDAEGPEDEFWAVTFRSKDLGAGMLRIYYAWSTGGAWSASEGPRYAYAGHAYLYKIQLASSIPSYGDSEEDDPCSRFLRAFLPEARRYLVAPSD